MNNIINIAHFTFIKLLKKKILYGIFFIELILIYLMRSLNIFGIGVQPLVLVDSILFVYEIFGFILILAITAGHIRREIETKSIYLVLSKPTDKVQYLLGKIIGIYAFVGIYTVLTILAVMFFAFAPLKEYAAYTLLAIIFRNFFLFIFTSILIFFSIFLRPTIMVMASFISYIFAMISYDYVDMVVAQTYPQWVVVIIKLLKFVLPNSEFMDIKLAVMQLSHLNIWYIISVLLYMGGYMFFLILFAAWIFGKKEF